MSTPPPSDSQPSGSISADLRSNLGAILAFLALVLTPFILAFFDGQSIADVLTNQAGASKFIQGLLIEVFILAIYALSYDLILGIVGVLSFGHAMFFAVGAYLTGILLKSFGWSIGWVLLAVVIAGVLQALLFGVILARVQGITFALVTLGIATVFFIIIQTHEVAAFTGSDVGLQGVPVPELLNSTANRLRFYYLALISMFGAYLFYRRFVSSPTGHVAVAIRENEPRARMLGFNTWVFKLIVLVIASITAALAGFLHALHSPIITPNIASLGYTVTALLIILIGGVGTLSGALVGAFVYRLMEFYLDRWFGDRSGFIIGLVYVALVMFLPYGIVGTWQQGRVNLKSGWDRLRSIFNLPNDR
jgi:branched-chain amino acid transport system permease protein